MAKYNWGELWPQVEDLLQQGIKKPKEIAEIVGVNYAALYSRIRNHNLYHLFDIKPSGKGNRNKEMQLTKGVPMETVLTPDECEKMRMFLGALITYANKTEKPDISSFMNVVHKEGLIWEGRGESGESV